jgi:energy-coupling factor transporter ATP-binding protein EcfA2
MTASQFDLKFARGQLTDDQLAVLRRMRDLAVLHFEGVPRNCAIEPRLWPLVVGPTGSGKSFLVRQLARYMGAHYLHVTYGGWIVQGARSTCTQFSILDATVRHSRLVVHLDELDKLPTRGEQEWARAVMNEVWGLLDLELPVARFVADADAQAQHSANVLGELAVSKGRGRIFIVGSGTWQDLFDQAGPAKGQVGFAPASATAPDFQTALERVIATGGPMSELLARFDGAVQLIRPPTLPEALAMLERVGARSFAREVGYNEVRVLEALLSRQGFRALQSVVTELMLRGWRPAAPQQPEAGPPAKGSGAGEALQKLLEP